MCVVVAFFGGGWGRCDMGLLLKKHVHRNSFGEKIVMVRFKNNFTCGAVFGVCCGENNKKQHDILCLFGGLTTIRSIKKTKQEERVQEAVGCVLLVVPRLFP